jgi:hypothetical protein
MPRQHYVYVSFRRETRQFYIGCRSSLTPDDGYMGSGVWVWCMQDLGIKLEKEVLKTFATRDQALVTEQKLICAFRSNPLCMNHKHTKNWIAPALTPPAPPRGLKWPPQIHDTEFWNRRHGVKVYLETYWVPFLERRLVDMEFLRTYYPSAMMAIYRFATRRGDTPGKLLPPKLRVPARSKELQAWLEKRVCATSVPSVERPFLIAPSSAACAGRTPASRAGQA